MSMKYSKALQVVAGCCLVISGCATDGGRGLAWDTAAQRSADWVPTAQWTLELTGSGLSNPTTWSYAQLAELEKSRASGRMECGTGRVDDLTVWQGPSLETLLTAAGAKPGPLVLSFEAADGFGVRCRREEAAGAVVALRDGKGRWLAEINDEVPLRMISPSQGAKFWIVNLTKIKVEPAAGG